MNDIGRSAGVAKRTLYNAFQTRERMIAAAIQEYFEEYVGQIEYEYPVGTMMHNLERMTSVIQRNQKIRNYIRAIMALYFSPEVDRSIWTAMHSMTTRSNLEWLEQLRKKKQLQPWIDVDRLVDDLVRYEYATIHSWAFGHIPDDEIVIRLVSSYLTFLLGATRGAARNEIEALLRRIKEQGAEALPGIRR